MGRKDGEIKLANIVRNYCMDMKLKLDNKYLIKV